MAGITIKEIAKKANVSVSTVSRVLNSNYPVSEDTRAIVEAVIRESNYRPNAIARSLRSSKSKVIALIVPSLSNMFFMRAAEGIEQELISGGYTCTIASSGRSSEKEKELVDMFLERRIDGLAIASSDFSGESISACLNEGIPVVAFDRNINTNKCGKVLWNNIDGARALTEHLISRGHTKIGIVNVSLDNENGTERLKGFRDSLHASGISIPDYYISGSNITSNDAIVTAKRLLSLPDRPTALFCANEVVLDGTLTAMRELGLKLGKDVSIDAFGTCECNNYIYEKITTCDQDCSEMGRRTGSMLKKAIEERGYEPECLILDTTLVYRDSVKEI